MEWSVTVRDRDGDIVLTRQDFLNYTGYENVIASALMIRLCHFTFTMLSPKAPVCRRELYWQLGFPGTGILDCVELVSRAVREGRCLQNPDLSHPDADPPASLVGHFLFIIGYRGRTLAVWPDRDVFDDAFRQQVAEWQNAADHRDGYDAWLAYKAVKVRQILTLADEDLLRWTWV